MHLKGWTCWSTWSLHRVTSRKAVDAQITSAYLSALSFLCSDRDFRLRAASGRFDCVTFNCNLLNRLLQAMTIKRILYAIVLVGLFSFGLARYWPRPITVVSLSQQLEGVHCRFAHDLSRCYQRGIEPLRSLFTKDHDCDMWAVRCLTEIRSPSVQDAMIKVLVTKADVQTCDGVRPIRSYAVKYLGELGSKSALPALKKHLATEPKSKLSAGASGCQAGPEIVDTIQSAIEKLSQR